MARDGFSEEVTSEVKCEGGGAISFKEVGNCPPSTQDSYVKARWWE